MDWYDSLAKPEWTPTGATISMIWQILYAIILVSFGVVFIQKLRGRLSWFTTAPFIINLLANILFTPIMFGMQNLMLAAVDILIVWTTIIWMMVAIWKHHRWAAIAQIPYFIWVTLATYLQLSITWMNS